jgi:hypothetical protein
MTVDQLTTFLGWTALLNIIYMFLALSAVTTFRDKLMSIHMKMMPGLKEEELPAIYFRWLGQYKIVTMSLFVLPFLALWLFV